MKIDRVDIGQPFNKTPFSSDSSLISNIHILIAPIKHKERGTKIIAITRGTETQVNSKIEQLIWVRYCRHVF